MGEGFQVALGVLLPLRIAMSVASLAPASEEARGGVSPAMEATEEGGITVDHIAERAS